MAACATERGVADRPGREPEAIPPLPESAPAPPKLPPPVGATRQLPAPAGGFPRNIQESGAGPAVLSLYRQAQDSRKAGRFDAALAQLERALRIEPRNAFVWQSLADVHLQLQHADQAESAAQKSTSLGRGNPFLDAGNWHLIAVARQARGDAAGAKQASARADALSGSGPLATP